MERMNKTKSVMMYLKEHGKINSWEAIKYFGATRLSAIIFNLRNRYEMNIINERVDFTDRYETKSFYDNYVLVEKENEDK